MKLQDTLDALVGKPFKEEFWGKDTLSGKLFRYNMPIGERYTTPSKQGYASIKEYSDVFPEGASVDDGIRYIIDPGKLIEQVCNNSSKLVNLEYHFDTHKDDKYLLETKVGEFERYDASTGVLHHVSRYAKLSFWASHDHILPIKLEIKENISGTASTPCSEKQMFEILFMLNPNDAGSV